MTELELRKTRKKALIQMCLNQEQEKNTLLEEKNVLEKQLAELKKKLEDKEICISNAGTIAEAAFEMNGVLEAAQAAAQQYLDNVKTLTERQEAEWAVKEKALMARCIAQEQATHERCSYMREETEKACNELEMATKLRCDEMERTTKENCELREREAEEKCLALTQKAEQDIEAKWMDLSTRLEDFYRAHAGLKKLLTAEAAIQRN